MNLRNGDTIYRTDPYRHKYDSALCEYVFDRGIEGDFDLWSYVGSPDIGEAHYRVSPKRILENGDRGDVWLHRFDSVEKADAVWAELSARFVDPEDEDDCNEGEDE